MSEARRLTRQQPWFANFLLTEARGYRSRAIRIVEPGRWPVGTIFDNQGNALQPATIPDASFVLMEPVWSPSMPGEALVMQRDAEVNSGYLLYGPLEPAEVNRALEANSRIIPREPVFGVRADRVEASDVWINPPVAGISDGQTMFEHLEANKLDRRGDSMEGVLTLANDPLAPLEAATKSYVDQAVAGAVVFIGALDADQDLVRYTAPSGIEPSPGPLIPPDQAGEGRYVICEIAGTMPAGSELAGQDFERGDWAISDGIAWTHLGLGGTLITAGGVVVDPPVFNGANVQDALQEAERLVGLKVDRAGDTIGPGGLVIRPDAGTALELDQADGATLGLRISGNPQGPAAQIEGNVQVDDGDIVATTGFVMARHRYFISEFPQDGGYILGNQDFDGGLRRFAGGPVAIAMDLFARQPQITASDGGNPRDILDMLNGVPLAGNVRMTGPLQLVPLDGTEPSTQAVNRGYVDSLVTGGTRLIGAFNAPSDICRYIPAVGIPQGPLVAHDDARIAPGDYLVCVIGGQMPPSSVLPSMLFEVGDWVFNDGTSWLRMPLGSGTSIARNVIVDPPVAGADNVQEVLEILDVMKVSKAGDTMGGDLTIDKVSPALHLVGTGGGRIDISTAGPGPLAAIIDLDSDNSQIALGLRGQPRWLNVVTSQPIAPIEARAYLIARVTAAGGYLDAPLWISPADGRVNLLGVPTAANHAATKGYVDGIAAPSPPALCERIERSNGSGSFTLRIARLTNAGPNTFVASLAMTVAAAWRHLLQLAVFWHRENSLYLLEGVSVPNTAGNHLLTRVAIWNDGSGDLDVFVTLRTNSVGNGSPFRMEVSAKGQNVDVYNFQETQPVGTEVDWVGLDGAGKRFLRGTGVPPVM